MSATVLRMRGQPPADPPPPPPELSDAEKMAYAPPFPPSLKRAALNIDAANRAIQTTVCSTYTTVGKALDLPEHLRRLIAAAQSVLDEIEAQP